MPSSNFFNRLILRIKRAESPFTRLLKSAIRLLYTPTLPPLPKALRSPLRAIYEAHYLVILVWRWLITILYWNPLFQSRCESFGRNVKLQGNMPFVNGHVQIHIGDDVDIGGNLAIFSGRAFDEPRLVLGNRASLGWNVTISVSREVIIEEDARIPSKCWISDSDGHPREADLRRANLPPLPEDIRPVRICKNAWIGTGCYIMKGVTIGEGAIIGANSVVISNIPPYSLALGNPAEVLFKNYGRPSTERPQKKTTPGVDATPVKSEIDG